MSLIGHARQKRYFSELVKDGRLGHAYLFTGQEMIGKRTFALELFRIINGRDASGDPDLISVAPQPGEGELTIGIEHAEKLSVFFSRKPYIGPYKFALIDEAQTLTLSAANALLKLIEEPAGSSVIVLISSVPGLLLPTIRSRCEEVRFAPAGEKETGEYISGKKINKDDADFAVKLACGRIGFLKKLIEEKELTDARDAVEDLRKLFAAPVHVRLKYAKKVHENESYLPMTDYWLSWLAVHVRTAPKNEKMVKDLLLLRSLLNRPQINHRLALENFLLNL